MKKLISLVLTICLIFTGLSLSVFATTSGGTGTGTISGFTFTDYTYPVTVDVGSSFTLSGTVTCENNITKIRTGIYNSDGTAVSFAERTPNAKSFSISSVDNSIKFGTLSRGMYTYMVEAIDSTGNYAILLMQPFSVGSASENTMTKTYTTTASSLTLRSGIGSSYDPLGYMPQGTVITVDSVREGWAHTTYNGKTGWCSGKYLTLNDTYVSFTTPTPSPAPTPTPSPEPTTIPSSDTDFEAYMTAQGFPESYKPYLRTMHQEHPAWVFTALNTGLTWSFAVSGEMKEGTNLINNKLSNIKSSWKATDVGSCFNWNNCTWKVYIASDYVQVSEEYLSYCLDPRNFLNSNDVFQFELLTYSSNQTIAGVNAILKGTFMYGKTCPGSSKTYAQVFMEAGQKSHVSPYLLASRVRQEQGVNGTSDMISGTYPGYTGLYNYFNISAAGSTHAEVVSSGLSKARSEGWTSPYLSILGGANFLYNGYISKGQDTYYLQKFDMVYTYNSGFWHQYMQNILAPQSEAKNSRNSYSSINVLDSAFVFKIPVYSGMPASACPLPTKDGCPNNKLSALSVSGYSISPSFNRDTYSYSLSVPYSVSSISISATKLCSSATISGTGNRQLREGDNAVTVNVTAQNGDVRSYTINVKRAFNPNATPTPVPTPVPTATPTPVPTATPTPRPTDAPSGKEVKFLSITHKPNKLVYGLTEELDIIGLSVTALFTDGTSCVVDNSELDISGYDSNVLGYQKVYVSYGGYSKSFTVQTKGSATVRSIKIVTKPNKLYYRLGETLDLTGISVVACGYDDSQSILSNNDLKFYYFDSSEPGLKTVSVVYLGYYTTGFSYRVSNEKSLKSLTVYQKPNKLVFKSGTDSFSYDGLILKATYYDNSYVYVYDSQLSPTGYNLEITGVQKVYVTYGGMTASYSIRVT